MSSDSSSLDDKGADDDVSICVSDAILPRNRMSRLGPIIFVHIRLGCHYICSLYFGLHNVGRVVVQLSASVPNRTSSIKW